MSDFPNPVGITPNTRPESLSTLPSPSILFQLTSVINKLHFGYLCETTSLELTKVHIHDGMGRELQFGPFSSYCYGNRAPKTTTYLY